MLDSTCIWKCRCILHLFSIMSISRLNNIFCVVSNLSCFKCTNVDYHNFLALAYKLIAVPSHIF